MGIIHVLDKTVAELIAAGEVVERPSSAVKELIENAIDAKASAITVEIKNGGMSFIRVTDDGCGFFPEDVKNAFLRHATSKVKSAEDLDEIRTMGFRGEALASIAAVAKVELLSRRKDAVEGVRYRIEASQEIVCEPAGCPAGTTIVVRDLFYNTPARLKFLKKDVSEANAVSAIVEKIALAYPKISFSLVRDGQQKLHTPGDGQLLSAIYSVFGRDFASGLLLVDYQSEGLAVKGFVSKPHAARANRSMQNFYVNHRYVKSRTCAAALEESYKHSIMTGKFPACVLDLQIPPQSVDVNVHPAKIEVRFEREKPVFDLLYFAVKNALRAADLTVEGHFGKSQAFMSGPADTKLEKERMSAEEFKNLFSKEPVVYKGLPFEKKLPDLSTGGYLNDGSSQWLSFDSSLPVSGDRHAFTEHKKEWPDFFQRAQASLDIEVEEAFVPRYGKEDEGQNAQIPAEEPAFREEEKNQNRTKEVPEQQTILSPSLYENLQYIGEAFCTYILFEGEGRLVLVDKHAAHERILYNRLKKGEVRQFIQNLLSPVPVLLSQEEHSAALDHLDTLLECGFEAEDFGNGTLLVRSAPMWLESAQIEQTVVEICGYLAQGKRDVSPERLDWLYHNISCRAAIKGGDHSTPEELKEILRLMQEDKTVFHCPHGRPVAVVLTKKEIEKQFGRI